jgi:hypothetical protein
MILCAMPMMALANDPGPNTSCSDRRKLVSMTDSERVAQFLTSVSPKAFCDECIARRLGFANRQQAQHETSVLAEIPGFSQRQGHCSTCEKTKLVIVYAPRFFDLPSPREIYHSCG